MEHLLEYQQPQIQLNQYARICCRTRLLLSKVRGFAFAALILNTEHAYGEIPSSFVRIAGLLKPMNRTLLVMIVSLVALLALVGLLATGDRDLESGPIKLYCAASNRAVMESIKAQYEEEMRAKGYTVIIDYGPSQMELSKLEVTRDGDLFLPADDSYITLAQEKGLAAEVIPIARQQGVVAVRKGNPKGIKTFADLLREDVRLLQASPKSAAIGKVTKRVLTKQGLWEQLDKATTAYFPTVTEVANGIAADAADAGIVYDAVLSTYDKLEFVTLTELEDTASDIFVTVTTTSQKPQRALHFARYISAVDRGLKHYADFGFQTEDGDDWADTPELSIFAGSMLRPAIDDTISRFEAREGIVVNRDYNGCGILVAQMQSGKHPDAYFACDTEFMKQVPDLFPDPVDVSQNELVILVQKGNPHGIESLKDLAKKGVRVGLGHEKQCAMGWLTQNTLKEGGVLQEVMENVAVQTPTGDMLVNQMLTGSLDAAVVYLSNAAGAQGKLEAYRIQDIKCSIATQPFAIAEKSRYRQLSGRLFEQICSAQSREDFEAEGFLWKTAEDSIPVDPK